MSSIESTLKLIVYDNINIMSATTTLHGHHIVDIKLLKMSQEGASKVPTC